MDLVLTYQFTCNAQILIHAVLTPQLVPLGRAGGKNLGFYHLIGLQYSLAYCIGNKSHHTWNIILSRDTKAGHLVHVGSCDLYFVLQRFFPTP